MSGEVGLIVKVLLLSLGLAIAIKQIAPHLPISASTGGVLVSVLLPSVVMAGLLGWRSRRENAPR